jgi:hypothetical protein
VEAAEVVLRFCDAEFPTATTVVLGGSSSTGRRTASSDLDVLLIAPRLAFAGRAGAEDSVARVAHRDGERIDVFAYTTDAYRSWSERDFASLRPVLPFLLAEGTPLRTGPEYEELRAWSLERLAAGPHIHAHEFELRRYAVTDLIDDLADATDALTIATIRADLLRALGELALLRAGGWLGSGKWLARRLRAADPPAADALEVFASEAHPRDAAARATGLLGRLGGRIDVDFVR